MEKQIDLTYLKEIANGSNEFICQMINVFTTETPKEINNLEKHLNNKDWQLLRGTAHKMKPSFTFMGIKKLESIIHTIEENSANETNLAHLPELFLEVKQTCNQAIIELEDEKNLFCK
jgi:HPt (histidine-containing phosphotransfer) domain-containing protein